MEGHAHMQPAPHCQTAVHVNKNKPGEVLSNVNVEAAPIPQLGDDEVLVRVDLRPVNPADIFSVMGVYAGFTPKEMPAVPGLDGEGHVEAVGSACKKLKTGQRVTAAPWPTKIGNGTWQQFLAIKENELVPVPDDITDEFAAMAFVNPVTVYGLLEAAAVPAGEYLLVTAVRSALSQMLVPLAKQRGIKVIGTVRRKDQLEMAEKLGVDLVSTEDEGWAQQVRKITGGKGAYSTLDCVAGNVLKGAIAATRDNGTVILYGLMEGMDFSASGPDFLFRGVQLRGFWLSPWFESLPRERRQEIMEEIWELHRQGIFTAPVEKILPLESVKEALEEALKQGRHGKIMLQG